MPLNLVDTIIRRKTLIDLIFRNRNLELKNHTNAEIRHFINQIYAFYQNTKLFNDPTTRQNVFRRNLTFVKFVEPPPTNKNNNKPSTKNQKTGYSAQSRRTNGNNNTR